MEECRICQNETHLVFEAMVLQKFQASYYHCARCGFLQTSHPAWLDEAYKNPINFVDTGLLARNMSFANIVTTLLFYSSNRDASYLDYAGGYGVFTRLMRDIGFAFYWSDPFTPNLFARGFEYDNTIQQIEAVTSFETFEHFVDPLREIEKMLAISDTIFFSTELLPSPVPKPKEWWYYGLDHGQHISFYSRKTLKFIADKFRLNFYSFGPIHVFTNKKLHYRVLSTLLRYSKYGVSRHIKKTMRSKTFDDSVFLTEKHTRKMSEPDGAREAL